jgi:signal transduction histidine kinase
MLLKRHRFTGTRASISLPVAMTVPVVLSIFIAISLVGYLSLKNGQQAIYTLAQQLQNEVGARVDTHLAAYLALPHQINQLNKDAMERGIVDPLDIESAGRYFWKQSQVFPQFSYIGYALTDNTGAGAGRWLEGHDIVISQHPSGQTNDYAYAATDQGERSKLVFQTEYSAIEDEWYTDTVKANRPIWGQIYTSEGFGAYVAAGANTPLYDKNRKLMGVLSIDLLLSDISKFLQTIQISPNGQIFILERDGHLIASSADQPILFQQNEQYERYSFANSPNPLIQGVGKEIQRQFKTLDAIQAPQDFALLINGQQQYVHVEPWKDEFGLDWLVFIAAPESDFTAQITKTAQITILLCIAALLIATPIGIMASRWVTRPILAINQASRAMSMGDFRLQVKPSRIRELNAVGQSFNQMVAQLQASFTELEHNNAELENRVASRTQELSDKNIELQATLQELSRTQSQMIQTEKMSALGQLVAGVAHEINNPVNFIHGNISYVQNYLRGLLDLVQTYQQHFPHPPAAIQAELESIDLDFLSTDSAKLLSSMQTGSERIREIVLSLRNFARLDEADLKFVDIHSGIDSTLLILQHRLHPDSSHSKIQLVKAYGDLPPIECYAGQLNQVFMNLLTNAIDALQDLPDKTAEKTILIQTNMLDSNHIRVMIADNGIGIAQAVSSRLFDPFFTTKPVGKGTGLGLAISYQIITEKHKGKLYFNSTPGQGTQFYIEIPVQQLQQLIP